MYVPISNIFTRALAAGLRLDCGDNACTDDISIPLSAAYTQAVHAVDMVLSKEGRTASFEPELRRRFFGDVNDNEWHYVMNTFTRVQANWDKVPFKAGDAYSCDDPSLYIVCAGLPSSEDTSKYTEAVSVGPLFYTDDKSEELRAEMLVHEMTHAVASPSTDDVVFCGGGYELACYGDYTAIQLGAYFPKLAVRNAENYGFYAMEMWYAINNGGVPRPGGEVKEYTPHRDQDDPAVDEVIKTLDQRLVSWGQGDLIVNIEGDSSEWTEGRINDSVGRDARLATIAVLQEQPVVCLMISRIVP